MAKTKIRSIKQAHQVHLGAEAKYKDRVLSTSEVTDAYNWYSYFCEPDDAKKYTLTWLKNQKAKQKNQEKMDKVIAKLSDTKDYNFRTLGWICRLLTIGSQLPKHSLEWRDKRIAELMAKSDPKTVMIPSEAKPTRTPVQKQQDQLSEIIGTLDVELDKISIKNQEIVFKPFDYLMSKLLKSGHVKSITAYYIPIHAELSEAIKKPDEQLSEAYRIYKKPHLKRMLELVSLILTDCNRVGDQLVETSEATKPKLRKARKKKVKTPEQLVSKIVFKFEDKDYGVTSIGPREIIKASQLWTFNSKTRNLGYYISSGVDGLSVKGSKVINFDDKLSLQKKLRKPGDVLKSVVEAGKVSLRGIMGSVKAKESKVNGRINEETILLKVVR